MGNAYKKNDSEVKNELSRITNLKHFVARTNGSFFKNCIWIYVVGRIKRELYLDW